MVGEIAGLKFSSGAATTVGKVRKANEDAFLTRLGAYVVADGMGGHQAGDGASRLVVEAVSDALNDGVPSLGSLATMIDASNAAIRAFAADVEGRVMGSTLVGVFCARNADDHSLVVVNVGDSRCYSLTERGLQQVSVDHSQVQELVAAGRLSSEEAKHHPERNVVTRAIGADASVVGDYFMLSMEAPMRLLLCSDGVSGELDDERISRLLLATPDPQRAAEGLIDEVMLGRAADNATAVVIDFEPVMVQTPSSDVASTSSGTDLDVTAPRNVGPPHDETTRTVISDVPHVQEGPRSADELVPLIDGVPDE